MFLKNTDFLNCPKLKIKKRSRLSDMRFDLNELLGNFQQSSHENNSDARHVDVDLKSKTLHEDVSPNEDEFRALSNSNSKYIGRD